MKKTLVQLLGYERDPRKQSSPTQTSQCLARLAVVALRIASAAADSC